MSKLITFRQDGEDVDVLVDSQQEYDYYMENFDIRKVKSVNNGSCCNIDTLKD